MSQPIIHQNQPPNQPQITPVKKSDDVGFMDRILWHPLAKKLKRTIVPFKQPGKAQQYEPLLATTSNQVLLHVKDSKQSSKYPKKSFTYFVPTYIRLVIKNFTNIDHSKLEAEANVSIMITFVYGNEGLLKLPEEVAARLYNEVVLNFERDESLRLTAENDNISVKEKQEKSEITFTVRRKVHMRIQPDIHYTPFQYLRLFLPITIQQLPAKTMLKPPIKELTNGATKFQETVKFNFMDRPETKLITIDYKKDSNFGNYALIENSLCAKYSNDVIKSENQPDEPNSKDDDKKIKNFQYASFEATIYKRPLASLFNIFFPLWGLALINLVIYFQSTNLAERIASIATLMVAFIALDDNIRIQIPPHPKVLFIEYLVYAEITASLVCLWHSFMLRNVDPDEQRSFQWTEILTLGLYCIIMVVQIVLVFGRTLYHYKVQVPNFGLSQAEKQWYTYKGRNQFDHLLWSNEKCNGDEQFKKIIAKNRALSILYKSQWSRKLQDLNEEIRRKAAHILFSYIKPSPSMMSEINEQVDILCNSHLLRRN